MINAQEKHVAYSGGRPYVQEKDGEKIGQIPIDPATQQSVNCLYVLPETRQLFATVSLKNCNKYFTN